MPDRASDHGPRAIPLPPHAVQTCPGRGGSRRKWSGDAAAGAPRAHRRGAAAVGVHGAVGAVTACQADVWAVGGRRTPGMTLLPGGRHISPACGRFTPSA